MKKRIVVFAVLISTFCNHSVFAESLKIIMDYYPPFSYEKNGEIKGLSTQVVMAVVKEAGMDAVIKQYPFARAYNMTQKNKDIFEYCVVRTPEREKLFKWVGIVGTASQGVFALKTKSIKIEKTEDLTGYIIGTVIEDVIDQYLFARKDRLGLRLERISSYKSNMQKLMTGRVDLWAGNKLVGIFLSEELGYNRNQIKHIYTIEALTDHFYLATGLKTSDKIVQKLQEAFKTVHDNGTYQKIVNEYSE